MSVDQLTDDELLARFSELKNSKAELDANQMAKKIAINSLYGKMGTPFSRFYDVRCAAGVTLCGRTVIRFIAHKLNEFMNQKLNTDDVQYLVYADTDSVAGESVIRVNGKDAAIADFFDQSTGELIMNDELREHYVKELTGYTTLTVSPDSGEIEEKSVKYVMKHRVQKEMFEISLPTGESVVVTEDHSIVVMTKDNTLVVRKPKEITPSDSIVRIIL